MREIVLDTETTGLSPAEGHRIVEIGAVEMINRMPSGRTYHQYINPQRDMPTEAFNVHGLSSQFLVDKPEFSAIAEAFLEFVGNGVLVIHNASFDMAFINYELSLVQKDPIPVEQVIDTLAMSRKINRVGQHSLDALCRRYGIDNSRREKHGALLDSELLAEVYIELTGGRQASLVLREEPKLKKVAVSKTKPAQQRHMALKPRLTEKEKADHQAFINQLGADALWMKR